REDLGLPAQHQNSWRFALDRLLMSYLNQPQAEYADIYSMNFFDESANQIIGPLYDLIERLGYYRQQMLKKRPISKWVELFSALLDDFFAASAISEQTVLADEQVLTEREAATSVIARLQDALSQWQEQQEQADFNEPISYQIAAEGWLACTRTHRLQQRFLVGSINFATLMPMRSIPFRHIWLLGLDDQSYPRRTPVPDFDLMQSRYRPGDRSRREDDRYLFLEALLSAREQLSISWVGRDIRDNHERPASVLVNQLLDHIDRGWVNGTKTDAGHSRVVDHPLQPFSADYYRTDQPALFTYNHDWIATDRAATKQEKHSPAALHPPCVIEQNRLRRFFAQPGLAFFQDRLNIPAEYDQPAHLDDEPFMPTAGLDGHAIKQRLVSEIVAKLGRHPDPSAARMLEPSWLDNQLTEIWRRLKGEGLLPFAPFEQILKQQMLPVVKSLLDDWLGLLSLAENHTWLSLPADQLELGETRLLLDSVH
ncbi:MAG TPA: hypothetical protein ENM98_05730, partial [Halothiobacillaceae bacterium]|nr:hypothetical protein [Halothiobacillaceae bacterium]